MITRFLFLGSCRKKWILGISTGLESTRDALHDHDNLLMYGFGIVLMAQEGGEGGFHVSLCTCAVHILYLGFMASKFVCL